MVANSKPTRNSAHRHAQSIGRQRKAAQRAQAEVSAEDLTPVLPPNELPMLPDSELVATTGAAPGPELQRAVMSACQYVQHQYEGTVDSARLMRAADIVLANGVKHLDAHRAVVTSSGKLYKTENGACPCSDYTHRSVICKHVLATAISRQVNILMAPEPEDVGDAKDGVLNSFMPLGSWRDREPVIVHSIKWKDGDGHEHLHIVRGDSLDEVLLHLRTVKAVINAARTRHVADDGDMPEVPVPPQPAVGEPPVCRWHGEMRPSIKAPGSFYCASKMADGSYCRERWPQR